MWARSGPLDWRGASGHGPLARDTVSHETEARRGKVFALWQGVNGFLFWHSVITHSQYCRQFPESGQGRFQWGWMSRAALLESGSALWPRAVRGSVIPTVGFTRS